ncbi:MAG: hypothetical protein FJ148_18715 [Deltaproteobacteria bacterium]|nr:hypothetical protein [Deltaproteobacteria bacterium]
MPIDPPRSRPGRCAASCRRGPRAAHGLALTLALCARGATDRQPRSAQPAPAEVALPAARPCVSIARIERSEVVDNQTIRLHLTDGTIIRSRLPSPCHGLKIQGGFAFQTSTDQLCALDVIHLLPPSGGACALGPFELEHLAPGAEAPP